MRLISDARSINLSRSVCSPTAVEIDPTLADNPAVCKITSCRAGSGTAKKLFFGSLIPIPNQHEKDC
jgi:hypothetical protein